MYKKKCPRIPIESPHLPATLNALPSSPILTHDCSPSTSSMIKSFIDMPSQYSKFLNMVEGFEDLGHKGRTNKLAIQAMVFVVQGLYRFNIVTLVCDQGSNNYSALKHLGCCKEKPFFEIKDIKLAYNIDKLSDTSRALLKLTDSHINPNAFQKMNCKLALQVFSNSVVAVLKTCIATGQIKIKTVIVTADFTQELNNLFDCLNSKSLYSSYIYSCALNDDKPYILNYLMKVKEWCTQLELIQPIKVYGKVLPCFDAMVWSINSIIMIYTQQKNVGFKYLLTSRVNQDIIENTFSVFRQRGGFNRNPTARTFRTSFQFQSKHNRMKATEPSNCENDFDYNLFDRSSQNVTISTLYIDTDTSYQIQLNKF
ncbi:hypothetical protein QTP88_012854 [Uroleucon formosanum]